MTRASRLLARTVVVAAAVVLVGTAAGCDGALLNRLYLLETPRQAYLHEEFDDVHRWRSGAADGFEPRHEFAGGYFVAHDHRQFIVTNEAYPGHLEIRMAWEIWCSSDTPAYDNDDDLDFQIALIDEAANENGPTGPVVTLKLFAGGAAGADVVAISVYPDSDEVPDDDPVVEVVPSAGVSSGVLVILYDLEADPPRVTVDLVDHAGNGLLNSARNIPAGWPDRVHVAILASGRPDPAFEWSPEPRAIGSVYLLAPEAP